MKIRPMGADFSMQKHIQNEANSRLS